MATCKYCGRKHNKTYGKGKFCSLTCISRYGGTLTYGPTKNVYVPKVRVGDYNALLLLLSNKIGKEARSRAKFPINSEIVKPKIISGKGIFTI